jgi:serine/threonine protein kinase
VWNDISPGGKSMIKKMLTVDQKLRITCREALTDPWFAKFASKKIVEDEIMREIMENMRTFQAT